ncbi:transglycosylase SLT domain-containing protein [Streptomyces pratensis]|uniref:transglycosylase SLT domain-containing protein n=1 Tax=Streptomyces pratensis TaxID=1169025 RepID=UPI001931330A|nr:transglycosylase SLT domain-containing protein [Streptomyces pratensis]
MPENGKHRRSRTSSLTRGIIAVSTGGAALALPVIGATSAFAAPAQPAVVEKAATSTAASGKGIAAEKSESATYSVILGDTLAKIAREHSVSGGWKALYEGNQKVVGGNPDLIHPGLKLVIDAKAESKSADEAGKAESKASASSERAEESADRADRSERASTSAAAEGAPAAEATPAAEAAPAAEPVAYTDDLDGWIKESLAVMAEHGIPGTYEGIHRNIIRESGGNPQAINNWDSNAAAGIPSKGLLQVIDPTFEAYHVPGTSTDSYDPVANITAACNYAADKYGSIDNVDSAY